MSMEQLQQPMLLQQLLLLPLDLVMLMLVLWVDSVVLVVVQPAAEEKAKGAQRPVAEAKGPQLLVAEAKWAQLLVAEA